MIKTTTRFLSFAAAASAFFITPAHAVIAILNEQAVDYTSLEDDVSSTDLVQNGATSVYSVSTSHSFGSLLFDGEIDGIVSLSEYYEEYPSTVTITLNDLVKPGGYDIYGVSVFCGYDLFHRNLFGTDDVSHQRWTMEYSVVGDVGFTELLDIDVAPEPDKYASKVTAVLSGSSRLHNVDALRFTFLDPSIEYSHSFISEIDVFGPAPVPEPSSLLLGFAALSLVLRRRR
jgi:hypothetical protein